MPLDNRNKKDKLNEVIEEALQEAPEEPQEETKIEESLDEEAPEETTEEVVEEIKEVEEEETPVETPEVDYQKKYSESSKEALTQYFKNKKLTETIEEANNIPDPTEEELVAYARSTGSDYDDLDEFTKGVLKETLLNKRRFEKINDIVKESKEIDAWADKVEAYANSPETIANNPLIEENAEEFKKFCMKAQRRGMDLEDLSASFLYGLANSPVKKKKKGSMLLDGGGGIQQKPKGLTDEDAKNIRVNNPKEYRRLIKEGKIKLEI